MREKPDLTTVEGVQAWLVHMTRYVRFGDYKSVAKDDATVATIARAMRIAAVTEAMAQRVIPGYLDWLSQRSFAEVAEAILGEADAEVK